MNKYLNKITPAQAEQNILEVMQQLEALSYAPADNRKAGGEKVS